MGGVAEPALAKGKDAWLALSLFALVDGTAFQGCLSEGLQRTSAGLGSVIIDSQPLTVAILASIIYGETLAPAGVAGLGLGVVGLLMLELPGAALDAIVAGDFAGAAAAVTSGIDGGGGLWDSGEWWMLLAAQSMAVGTVMVRWVCKYVDPVMATGWHMAVGARRCWRTRSPPSRRCTPTWTRWARTRFWVCCTRR